MLKMTVSFVPVREFLATTALRRDALRVRGVGRGAEPGSTETVGVPRENVNDASGSGDKTEGSANEPAEGPRVVDNGKARGC